MIKFLRWLLGFRASDNNFQVEINKCKEVSIHLKESSVMKLLEDNPKVDELRQAKVKMKKVEDLLGGSE